MSTLQGPKSQAGRWVHVWLLLVVAAVWDLFARQSNGAAEQLYSWLPSYGYLLAWLVLVFVPAIMLEMVLAAKSTALPVLAVQGFTREIDAPKYFRWPTYLGVVLVGVLLLFVTDLALQRLLAYTTLPAALGQLPGWQLQLLGLGLLLLAVGVGVWLLMRYKPLMHGLALATVVTLLAMAGWGVATGTAGLLVLLQSPLHVLAWLAVLAGCNLWWWAGRGTSASPWRFALCQLPLMLTAMLAMLGLMLLAGTYQVVVQLCVAYFAAVWLGHTLLQAGLAMHSKTVWLLMVLLAVAATVLLLLQWQWLYRLLPSVALLIFASQCVLVGWRMKVSHVRKLVGLPNEAMYNVWRVWVRLVMPALALWLALQLLV